MSNKKHILMMGLAILSLVLILGGFLIFKILRDAEVGMAQLSQLEFNDIELDNVSDGQYFGEYEVFPISARVVVTVKNHVITEITLLEHKTGQGQNAKEILDKIIDAQSIEVDVISQATYSSIVIQKAIEIALTENQ